MFYCLAVKSTGGVQIWCCLQNCRSSLMGNWSWEVCKHFGSFSKFVPQSFHQTWMSLTIVICSSALKHTHAPTWSLLSSVPCDSIYLIPVFFSLWGSTDLIANQVDSSSAGSGSKLCLISVGFCVFICFFSEWGETGGSWRLLPFPSDLACNVGSLCMEYGPCYSATVQGLTTWV